MADLLRSTAAFPAFSSALSISLIEVRAVHLRGLHHRCCCCCWNTTTIESLFNVCSNKLGAWTACAMLSAKSSGSALRCSVTLTRQVAVV